MDGFLIIALVLLGAIVFFDKGRHIWLRYGWFTLLGFFLGWVGAALFVIYGM